MLRNILCKKLGVQAPGLSFKPYPGELGERLYNEISQQAWEAWLTEQTKLINEYRLNLMEPKARMFLEKEMHQFLWCENKDENHGFKENT